MSSAVQVLSSPHCLLSHDLINKLSVIVGQCELLEEHIVDPECGERLHMILRTAQAMAAALHHHHRPSSDAGNGRPANAAMGSDWVGDVYISQTSR